MTIYRTKIDRVIPAERLHHNVPMSSNLHLILWEGLQFDVIRKGPFYGISIDLGDADPGDGNLSDAKLVWASTWALFNQSGASIRGLIDADPDSNDEHWHAVKIDVVQTDEQIQLNGEVFTISNSTTSKLAGVLWTTNFDHRDFDTTLGARDHDGTFHSTS